MSELDKKNKRIIVIILLILSFIYVICLFFPLYSYTTFLGETTYYNGFIVDPDRTIRFGLGYLLLGTVIPTVICFFLIIFLDKKHLLASFVYGFIFWLMMGIFKGIIVFSLLMIYYGAAEYQTGFYLLVISWLAMGVFLLILRLIFEKDFKN